GKACSFRDSAHEAWDALESTVSRNYINATSCQLSGSVDAVESIVGTCRFSSTLNATYRRHRGHRATRPGPVHQSSNNLSRCCLSEIISSRWKSMPLILSSQSCHGQGH